MINERIESNSMEKYGRVMLVCGIGTVLVCIAKLILATEISLTGFGFWVDTLGISVLPIYMVFRTQKEFKRRSGQFIEWTNEHLTYKLKNEKKPDKILVADISNIQVNLDIIEIVVKDNTKHLLDISDFVKFEDRIKIKDNFEKMK